MSNSSDKSSCPKCGTPIPGDAPGGLCPTCVLEGAASTEILTATGGSRTAPPTVADLAPHFPDLEILELIGAGGMGAVYTARQPRLDRTVALKILSHDLAADPTFTERFNREARVLARLSHPNIVGVFDFGTAGPYCYLLMEYVDGVNLRQAMQAGGFTPPEALALVEDVCKALKFAHEEGILHRDIKPENVLIDSKGRVKIADFGIAKLIGEEARTDVTLTLQGSILGSPHYMAPEQFETPGDVDQRADIYSLGVVLYEMLTGELPIGRFAAPSSKAAMDTRIDEIVMRTLEKERQARFQSAEEVSTSVGALAKSPPLPPQAPPAQPTGERPTAKFSLAAAVLTGASLILGAVFIWLTFFTMSPVSSASPAAEVAESVSSRLPKMILAILLAVSFATTALLGFILGCKALGDIRESGGRKRGLGSATFGTLAWPVVLLFVLVLLTTNFIPSREGQSISLLIMFPLLLISGALAAFVLVRGVVRWAGGVEDAEGHRQHPGFGMGLLRALVIAILLPSLAVWMMMVFSGNKDERRGGQESAPNAAANAARSEDIRWRKGQPEVLVPITAQPGQRATLRLLLDDENGNARDFDLGEVAALPGARPARGVLQVGTTLFGTEQRMNFVFKGTEQRTSRTAEDFRGWEFNGTVPEELTFTSPGLYAIPLASLRENGQDTARGVLILEVVVTVPTAVESLRESR